ncbi:hypothetical protein CCR75_005585 [Bremia lactucae]|uniref:Uncharacterized protein n=1 Tax=Bremia lactucae TaxID=4779 RepID=A0A976ILC8_BRELC|nr:hypothetical protein CCR75_005585 [Bremia lactucae]
MRLCVALGLFCGALCAWIVLRLNLGDPLPSTSEIALRSAGELTQGTTAGGRRLTAASFSGFISNLLHANPSKASLATDHESAKSLQRASSNFDKPEDFFNLLRGIKSSDDSSYMQAIGRLKKQNVKISKFVALLQVPDLDPALKYKLNQLEKRMFSNPTMKKEVLAGWAASELPLSKVQKKLSNFGIDDKTKVSDMLKFNQFCLDKYISARWDSRKLNDFDRYFQDVDKKAISSDIVQVARKDFHMTEDDLTALLKSTKADLSSHLFVSLTKLNREFDKPKDKNTLLRELQNLNDDSNTHQLVEWLDHAHRVWSHDKIMTEKLDTSYEIVSLLSQRLEVHKRVKLLEAASKSIRVADFASDLRKMLNAKALSAKNPTTDDYLEQLKNIYGDLNQDAIGYMWKKYVTNLRLSGQINFDEFAKEYAEGVSLGLVKETGLA